MFYFLTCFLTDERTNTTTYATAVGACIHSFKLIYVIFWNNDDSVTQVNATVV